MQLAAPPVQSLDAYLRYAYGVPMLSEEEERQLAVRLREHNDLDAARRLVLPHLKLVVKVARGYAGYGLALSDLIQEGNIGLMKAVKRFDPAVGVRMASFAIYWIRAEIHQFVIRNWRIVKLATTKAQRKLFFKFRSLRKNLGHLRPAEAREIASALDVPERDVYEMEKRIGARDLSIHNAADDDDFKSGSITVSVLPDESLAGPEAAVSDEEESSRALVQLKDGIESLDARSRDIIRKRWLDERKSPLRELAAEYGVSAERIRQLEAAAFRQLRTQLPRPADCA
jgi:RNA polymerase sigma-32 factor